MGCDIHIVTERLQIMNSNERWVCADVFKKDTYTGEFYVKEVYSGRNYDLFALLAGVRNNSNIAPIDYPRGVPDDSCPETYKGVNCLGCDGHSHSYFTFAELYNYYIYTYREWDDEYNSLEGFMNCLTSCFMEEFWIFNEDKLADAVEKHGHEFRIVFWFDN